MRNFLSPSEKKTETHQCELAKEFVVIGHFALALTDLDLHLGLSVSGRAEDLGLFRRNRCVASDEFGEDAAKSFNTERQRRHIEEQNVGDITSQHATLKRKKTRVQRQIQLGRSFALLFLLSPSHLKDEDVCGIVTV